jgi:acetoin utilization deacetylase AcuC-like enzyme
VLDLDLHFGNGTAAGFPNDPDLFLFDYHGHAQDFFEPDTPHLFRNLASEPEGATYLARLKEELPAALDKFKPDFCLYQAGMDVFSGSSNPHLRLGVRDIEEREDFVFTVLAERGIPVAYAHGGGYASEETNARLHIITARAASRLFRSYRKK